MTVKHLNDTSKYEAFRLGIDQTPEWFKSNELYTVKLNYSNHRRDIKYIVSAEITPGNPIYKRVATKGSWIVTGNGQWFHVYSSDLFHDVYTPYN